MIPDYQTLMRPVLNACANGEVKVSQVVTDMADGLALTDAERTEMLPSGKQTVFANRVHWAKTYLKQAGLVSSTRRGYFVITDRGREVLKDTSLKINSSYLARFSEFQDFQSRSKIGDDTVQTEPDGIGTSDADATPDEQLRIAFKRINDALAAELLAKMRETTPAFFEDLIVQLFVAMGYGGTAEDAGRSLGRTGDDGVDGVIDQDILGVDQVYIQAKRYAEGNNVGSGAIRDFFGALSLKKAQKGVFVTTSDFSRGARDTAAGLGSRIVLISGLELARLALRYGIGCRTESTLVLMRIDEEFFDQPA